MNNGSVEDSDVRLNNGSEEDLEERLSNGFEVVLDVSPRRSTTRR